jgi:hypothetical protein
MEQCQVIGCPDQQPFWRMRKFCCDGIDPTLSVRRLSLSDMFVVVFARDLVIDTDKPEEMGGVLVWPIHRVTDMPPYHLPGLCNQSIDLRGRWLLVTYLQGLPEYPDYPRFCTTRVYDLVTRQWCMGNIKGSQAIALLQRVDDSSATVFFADMMDRKNGRLVEWTLWQFTVCQLQDYPRCIARGQYFMPYEKIPFAPIQRVDDKRVIVFQPRISKRDPDSEKDDQQESLTFAVISTESSRTDRGKLEMVAPLWSLYVEFKKFVILLARDQAMLLSITGWTLYNLVDGTRVWHMKAAVLEQYVPDILWRDAFSSPSPISAYAIPKEQHNGHFYIIDYLRPERTRQLKSL